MAHSWWDCWRMVSECSCFIRAGMGLLLDHDKTAIEPFSWNLVMGLIQKYILPKEVDFNTAMQQQVNTSRDTVHDLYLYCLENDLKALKKITEDERKCRTLKNQNMHELLDVFITPYDREAIYRIIDQVDWVSLSVKHLVTDLAIYKVKCPESYRPIFTALSQMADALAEGFVFLANKNLNEIVRTVNEIYVNYDNTVEQCAVAAANHLENDEIKVYLAHREILFQLKEVAKRIHVSANTLEDMAIKIV